MFAATVDPNKTSINTVNFDEKLVFPGTPPSTCYPFPSLELNVSGRIRPLW